MCPIPPQSCSLVTTLISSVESNKAVSHTSFLLYSPIGPYSSMEVLMAHDFQGPWSAFFSEEAYISI